MHSLCKRKESNGLGDGIFFGGDQKNRLNMSYTNALLCVILKSFVGLFADSIYRPQPNNDVSGVCFCCLRRNYIISFEWKGNKIRRDIVRRA